MTTSQADHLTHEVRCILTIFEASHTYRILPDFHTAGRQGSRIHPVQFTIRRLTTSQGFCQPLPILTLDADRNLTDLHAYLRNAFQRLSNVITDVSASGRPLRRLQCTLPNGLDWSGNMLKAVTELGEALQMPLIGVWASPTRVSPSDFLQWLLATPRSLRPASTASSETICSWQAGMMLLYLCCRLVSLFQYSMIAQESRISIVHAAENSVLLRSFTSQFVTSVLSMRDDWKLYDDARYAILDAKQQSLTMAVLDLVVAWRNSRQTTVTKQPTPSYGRKEPTQIAKLDQVRIEDAVDQLVGPIRNASIGTLEEGAERSQTYQNLYRSVCTMSTSDPDSSHPDVSDSMKFDTKPAGEERDLARPAPLQTRGRRACSICWVS